MHIGHKGRGGLAVPVPKKQAKQKKPANTKSHPGTHK